MLNSTIFKIFREAKTGYEIDFETALIQNMEKNSISEYFIIRSTNIKSHYKYIQIFNNEGICIFQDYDFLNNESEIMNPVLDVEIQDDGTTSFWKIRYSKLPNKEYPQNIRLVGSTTYVNNGIYSVFRKNEILEQNPYKKAIFPSELLRTISFMKDDMYVSIDSSIVIDSSNEEHYYLSVTAKNKKSIDEHLQVFNSLGICIFSGTSIYSDADGYFYGGLSIPTVPVIDAPVIEDWSSVLWGNRFASYNYDAEIPNNIQLLSTTLFINDGIYTVLYYGEEACQQGECTTCEAVIFSDIKRPICPNCGNTCALT